MTHMVPLNRLLLSKLCVCQQIPRLLCNPIVHYTVHKIPPLFSVLLAPCLCKSRVRVVLPSTSRSIKQSLVGFPLRMCTRFLSLACVLYAFPISPGSFSAALVHLVLLVHVWCDSLSARTSLSVRAQFHDPLKQDKVVAFPVLIFNFLGKLRHEKAVWCYILPSVTCMCRYRAEIFEGCVACLIGRCPVVFVTRRAYVLWVFLAFTYKPLLVSCNIACRPMLCFARHIYIIGADHKLICPIQFQSLFLSVFLHRPDGAL